MAGFGRCGSERFNYMEAHPCSFWVLRDSNEVLVNVVLIFTKYGYQPLTSISDNLISATGIVLYLNINFWFQFFDVKIVSLSMLTIGYIKLELNKGRTKTGQRPKQKK